MHAPTGRRRGPRRVRPAQAHDPQEFQWEKNCHVVAVQGKTRRGQQQPEPPESGVLREGAGGILTHEPLPHVSPMLPQRPNETDKQCASHYSQHTVKSGDEVGGAAEDEWIG